MSAIVTPIPASPTSERQQSFLAILPRIVARARAAFRSLRHYHDRQDAVADVVACAWERYLAADLIDRIRADELAAGAVADVRGRLTLAAA